MEQGDPHRGGLRPLALRQLEQQAALGGRQALDRDGGDLSAAQRPDKADEQNGAVAQPPQVMGDRRQDLAEDGVGGVGDLAAGLAGRGRGPGDPGERLGDPDIVGARGQAGGAVEGAEGGAAQHEGGGGEAAGPLAGQEATGAYAGP